MTPADRVALLLVVFAFLFLLRESFVRAARCHYCGEINGHEDHCPYSGSGL